MWVVTCDPGIDDAVALAVLAGRPGPAGLAAVVAGAGNVPAPVAWRNAAGSAALLGLDLPVHRGSTHTLDGEPITRGPSSHGPDGVGGLAARLPAVGDPPAADWPPLPADVIATGPLTDVARALRAGARVGRVVWMGGSVAGVGAVDPVGGEFNAAADARAADEVLASGVPVHVVPIEVTVQVPLHADDVAPWRSGPPAARLCAALVDRRREDRWPVLLHDPVAVVAATEPPLFRWEARAVRCDPDGSLVDAGDPDRPRVAVAVSVDAAAVRERIVTAVLHAGPRTP